MLLRKRCYRWFGLWGGLMVFAVGALSCGGDPPLGIQLRFAEAGLVGQITHADLAVFTGGSGGIQCSTLTQTNYYSDSEPIHTARKIIRYINFQTEQRRVLLDALPEGGTLVIYVLGLKVVNENQKQPIAYGCAEGISLSKGKIQKIDLIMKSIP